MNPSIRPLQPEPADDAQPVLPDDYHLHSRLCRHAEGEPADYYMAARRLGLEQICFTDHAPAPCGYDEPHRMQLDEFAIYRDGVLNLATHTDGPSVHFGIEADYYLGCRRFLEPWLAAQAFDLVLGSVHYIGDWGFDSPENRDVWEHTDIRQAWRDYFRLVGELADTGLFDVLTHPDLPKKFGHRVDDNLLRDLAAPALDRLAAADMALEINTAGLRKPVGEIYPAPVILALAHERKIPITFGSDAHAPGDVGANFPEAVTLATTAGYRERARFHQRHRTLVPIIPKGTAV